jgi:putative redox protein
MPEVKTVGDAVGEAIVIDETGLGRYQVEARAGSSTFLIDEPIAAGGLGSGPNPYDLLGSALGSCTLMTVRLYADRKKWPLARVRVRVTHHRSALQARDVFAREIILEGPLDDTQKSRLIEVAERCPVHLTLHRGADVETTLVPGDQPLPDKPPTGCEHMKDMEEACEK